MEKLVLVRPSTEYGDQIRSYRQEFLDNGDSMDGTSGLVRYEDPCDWLRWVEAAADKETCSKKWVPDHQYLCVRTNDNRVVGMIDIRQELNEYCRQYGGQIGYSIRKSERRKGYARIQLKLALDICREQGFEQVLITCLKGNTPSARTILSNGGALENEVLEPERKRVMQRYWISLSGR